MMPINNPDSIVLLIPEITKGMKSMGSKALLQINKHTSILDYQIQYIKKFYKNIPIFVLTGFDNDRIEKKIKHYGNIATSFNPNYETSNQTESLISYFKQSNTNNCLIINNGILLKEKLPINIKYSSIYTIKKYKEGFGLGINQTNAVDSVVSYLFYGLPIQWSECVFLNSEAIKFIIEISNSIKLHNLFLFELLNKLIDNNIIIKDITINKTNILKINILEDLNRIKGFYDKNLFAKSK